MKLLVMVAVVLGAACGKGGGEAAPAAGSTGSAASGLVATPTAPASALGVTMTIDGTPLTIAAADITTSFRTTGSGAVFKIFAGADGATAVVLTIPNAMTGPSSTPSGSKLDGDEIAQGSVSLQNFPERGYTTNSFNKADDTMNTPVPDALVVTSITADGKDAKVIAGTFHAKTFGSHSKGTPDPKDTDHVVVGTFRVRHEMSGDRF